MKLSCLSCTISTWNSSAKNFGTFQATFFTVVFNCTALERGGWRWQDWNWLAEAGWWKGSWFSKGPRWGAFWCMIGSLIHCTLLWFSAIFHYFTEETASGKHFACGWSGASDMSDRCGVRNTSFPFFHQKFQGARSFSDFYFRHLLSESKCYQNFGVMRSDYFPSHVKGQAAGIHSYIIIGPSIQ